MNFKQVPCELVNNNIFFASKCGKIKINDKIKEGSKGNKGAKGYYRTFGYDNKNYYIHQLVFYAHSDLTVEQLQNGRVIFKNFTDDMIDENKLYKNRFEDLLFEPFKIIKKECTDELIEMTHPKYGKFHYNKWYDCISKDKKFTSYQIMPLNNSIESCTIKNINTNKILCTKSNNDYDPSINIVYDKKSYGILLSHLLLNSVFPDITINESVDHTDDNPLNQNIVNLQWMSISENSKKGQVKSTAIANSKKIEDKFEVFNLQNQSVGKFKMKKDLVQFMIKQMNSTANESTVHGHIDRALKTGGFAYSHSYKHINKIEDKTTIIEEDKDFWKELNINEFTKKYMVSKEGEIKLNDKLLKPYLCRNSAYSQVNINLGNKKYKKYYMHQLVWLSHKGEIPEDKIILHDDEVPLVNKYERNWLCDLSLGDHTTNNKKYHFQKRIDL